MSLENVKDRFQKFVDKFGGRLDVDKNGKINFDDFTAVYNHDIKKVAVICSAVGVAVGVVLGAVLF